MSGYIGYSMSRRALSAYDNGELPASKFKDELKRICPLLKGITTSDVKNYVYRSSWHHTSSKYNRTNFYHIDRVDESNLCNIYNAIQSRKIHKKMVKNGVIIPECDLKANFLTSVFRQWEKLNYGDNLLINVSFMKEDKLNDPKYVEPVKRWRECGFKFEFEFEEYLGD